MKEATGIIKWFYDEKKFGFIQPDEGDRILFTHEKFIADPDIKALKAGMKVRYKPIAGPKGLEARDVQLIGHQPDIKKTLKIGTLRKRKKIIKKIFDYITGKIFKHREKKLDKIITYYPRFKSTDDLTSHYHRATWYLPPLPGKLENVYMFHGIAGEAKAGHRPSYMFQAHRHSSHILLKKGIFDFVKTMFRSRLILVWKSHKPAVWKFLKLFGLQAVNVDTNDSRSLEYGRYADIYWLNLLGDKERYRILTENYQRFHQIACDIKDKNYTRSCVFGTGPSLETAYDFDFKGCLTIVCNSIIQDNQLLDHILPSFICAGDAVSHFGVSRYAEKFREDLIKAIKSREIYFLTTASFGYLLALNHPEIREKTILIEQAVRGPNYDLLHGFGLPFMASTLNIHMLPLVSTFTDEIFLLGCDGKSTERDNEDFWAHARNSQYYDLVDSGHLCHPTFIVNRQQDTYKRYLQSLADFITIGESKYGKTFLTLQPSGIPILQSRQIPGDWISAKPGERIVVSSFPELIRDPAAAVKNHGEKYMIKEKIQSLLSKSLGGVSTAKFDSYTRKVKISGWFLSPAKIDKILVYYGDHIILGPAKLNQPRLDVYEKYPRYNNRNPGFSIETIVSEPVDFSVNLPVYVKIFSNNTLIHTLKSKLIFDDTIKNRFEELLKNNTVYFNCIPNTNIDPGKMNQQESGCEIKRIDVDFQDYKQWLARVNYEKNYPKYVKEFPVGDLLNRKSLQHYLSIKLFGTDKEKNRGEIYLDVASSNSAFPDILTSQYKVRKVYRQDWLYKKGIHGNRIGSNAIDIPLPDQSTDKITLHCSWEHFEENSDVEFIKEAHRLLKEKGKICIIPLYLAEEYFAITSPGIWQEKYSRVTTVPPKFEKGMIVCIMEQIKQRQAKYYDLKTLSEKLLQPYKDLFDFEILHFANHKEHPGCPVFALHAARKSS